MTPTKESTKNWLKLIGKDRAWLAKECELSEGTINNWLSPSGPFPSIAIVKIQSLMNKYGEQNISKTEILPTRLVLELTEERMKIYEEAAALEGMPLRQWLMNIADAAAEQDAKKQPVKLVSSPSFPPIQPLGEKYFVEVIGNIAAGALAEGDTVPYSVKAEQPLSNGEYVLRVNGKSMEPDIMDGSLVVMRKHTVPPIPKLGTIVEYHDERGVTIKKLAQRKTADGKKEYILHSINPAFPDILPMDGGRVSAVYVRTLNQI